MALRIGILSLIAALTLAAPAQRVAVLSDNLPELDPAVSAAAEQVLRKAGFAVMLIDLAGRVAQMYKDEPMVLGYDIQNEPSASSVAGLRYDGEPSPTFRLKAYDRPTFDKEWAQAVEPFTRGSDSTFLGLVSGFAPAEPHQAVARALNQTYELWIGKHIEAIRVLGCGRTQRGCSRSTPSESEAEALIMRGLSSRDPTHRARSKSLN